jgi:hypothetical protein
MHEMTTHERFTRMFAHREADRIPIIDDPWGATIERWQAEGLPRDVSYREYFGLDALNPLEVKAGMDPLQLKQTYGDRLVLHGGINALLYNDIAALEEGGCYMATAVTSADIAKMIQYIEHFQEKVIADSKEAKKFLHAAGIYTHKGTLTKPYRNNS